MDFFDRHKALIITLLFFAVLLLGLFNFNLANKNKATSEFLMDLDNLKIEEPVIEKPEPEEAPKKNTRETAQTHRAFNEDQESRDENFDQKLNEIFEKNSALQTETSEDETSNSSGNFNLRDKKKEQVKKKSDGNKTSAVTSTKSGGIDHSSISFSLLGRRAVDIPNPVYTCDRSGKIVVNISVNAEGRVTSSSVNKGSSSTTNECLADQALEYAAQAVFSRLPGRNSQPGTITYNFKP
ncbi:MAG: TonB family protein [Flavobacteriaceae bacterium]|nr:TonB family protein [Flavobacteriaceae bacterium]